jgi:hypothetical protein
MFLRQGGGTVDGVLAVTQKLMEPLVGAVGAVSVPGYAPVLPTGVEDRILREVELKSPPDMPKQRFLIAFSQQLLDRLFHLSPAELRDVAAVGAKGAAVGNVQAWFADESRQRAVEGTTWSGTLPRTDTDFLMAVDSNMWTGKSNKDLVRDITYTVDRDRQGRLVGHVHAVFKNQGPPSKLNPMYLGYVRFYVPADAHLLTAGATDEGMAPDAPYRVLSVLAQVAPNEQRTVDLSYALPDSVAPDDHYHLLWVRQVGATADHYVANVVGHARVADSTRRTLDADVDFNPGGVRGFLHRRWILRSLGV